LGSNPSNQVTDLLARWSQGENAAREELVPLLYDKLRRLARRVLLGQRGDHNHIVKMRFFAGVSSEETAQAMGTSPATVKRAWAVARAWLYRELARSTHV
jgi:hypothetical protein